MNRQSVAQDKIQSLGKHSLTNKSISRNACVARESHIISQEKKSTLQTQHANVLVMVHCTDVGYKLPTNQVLNGYNGN